MPDIFIPLDTTRYSTLYNEIVRKGIFGNFVVNYLENSRDNMKKQYPTFEDFEKNFKISDSFYKEFMDFAKKEGVSDSAAFKFSNYAESFLKTNKGKLDSLFTSAKDLDMQTLDTMFHNYVVKNYNEATRLRNESHAGEYIKDYLRYEIARGLYGYGDAYRIFLETDDTFQQALAVMHDKKIFKKFKVYSGKNGKSDSEDDE